MTLSLKFIALIFLAAAPVAGSRSIWDGVYSKEQVARGKKAYDSLCARCHGEALGGGEDSPALVDKVFFKTWAGKSVGELVEYNREEMPSDGPGKVTRRQSTDITAYILSMNGVPTGETELAPNLEELNQILITPKK
jgi:mono/diheme cytochrome c family protein